MFTFPAMCTHSECVGVHVDEVASGDLLVAEELSEAVQVEGGHPVHDVLRAPLFQGLQHTQLLSSTGA